MLTCDGQGGMEVYSTAPPYARARLCQTSKNLYKRNLL